jgi:hypothetical protein
MAQVVSPRPLAVKARVPAQARPCGTLGEQSGTGTYFSPSTSGFPLSVSFHQYSTRTPSIAGAM